MTKVSMKLHTVIDVTLVGLTKMIDLVKDHDLTLDNLTMVTDPFVEILDMMTKIWSLKSHSNFIAK